MKHVCTNCHFFAKEHREPNTGRSLSSAISKDERDKADQGVINFVSKIYCLKCYIGVWDEGVNPDSKNRINRVSVLNRNDKCFFFPHDPSMMFGAAIELQKREQESRQIKRSNMYTRIGLWVAAGALFINAVIGIIRLSKCV